MANRKSANGPNNGFMVLCNCDGDPRSVVGVETSVHHVFNLLRLMDAERPGEAPHSAWRQCVGGFTLVFEPVEEK